ncbi:Ankyrin-3 [Penicillium chrysogenum]|uniref:Ankyrin-3 n=1 Tax=Penicillium chrysogenum TaxID=5076 RepID=A0A167VN26_PENCH|nr:Ankyrin-3 [Penicillium chrysogenum]
MEPVSFAIGIIGLAGLFSTCLDAVERFDSWKDYDFEFRALVAQFKAQKIRLARWGLAVGLEDDELSYDHNVLLDDPKIGSTIKEVLFAINAVCRDEDKAFLTPMLGADEKSNNDQLFHRHPPRESKRQKIGWVLRTKAKRVAQVDHFSKLVETLHNLIPIEDLKGYKGRKPTGDTVLETDAWRTELENLLKRMETQMEDEYRRDLHAWLLGSTSTNDLYEIFTERKIEGTCEWVLHQPWFLEWTSPDFPDGCAKVLWINGHAGSGKSVIWQRATRGDTLKLLRDLVIKVPHCTFILDGLDECRWVEQDHNSNDGASIVDFLEALQRAIYGTSTRILVVSRDEPEIRACLVNKSSTNDTIIIQHSITPEDVRFDLDMFSRSIVNKKLSTMTEATKSDISQKLAERCNGQFLWVQMQESQLRDWKSPKQLEKAINSTPPGLSKTYDREWMGISLLSDDNRERTISLLRWAAFALRPLSVSEIAGALSISANCDEVRIDEVPDRINDSYIETEIMRLGGSLIDIRNPMAGYDPRSRTVHLAHFTVKEYLLCNLPAPGRLLQFNSSLKSSTEGIENLLAAKMCLCYVDCEGVWQETSEEGRDEVLESFRNYASRSWYQHASLGNMRDSDLVKSLNQLFDVENPNWASWKEWLDSRDESQRITCVDSGEDSDSSTADDEQEIGPSNCADNSDLSVFKDGQPAQTLSMSPLYYAAWLGLTDTMDLLLRSNKYSINEQGKFGRTPLVAACERGNLEAVVKLLDSGADLEIAGDNEHTPLQAAACNGHAEVVKLLLEKGLNTHNGSDGSKTPLYCACSNGHHQVVQMLLQREPDMIDRQDRWIPLVAASDGGFLGIVQLLIQKGANVNVPTGSGRTPLYCACNAGHSEVMRLLLDEGAEIEYCCQDEWTAVNVASYRGFLDIVLLLIERGADINVQNEYGNTPLYNSCCTGHIEVVRQLLDKGADINRSNTFKWAPMNMASDQGLLDIVRLLIERGADINVQDEFGRTPLSCACYRGHVEVVKTLVLSGADLETANQDGFTPLNVASERGFLDIVTILVNKGVSLGSGAPDGWTSLHLASWDGYVDIVTLLLEKGAAIDSAKSDGWTSLHVASERGYVDIVTLLLEKGAAIDSATPDGWTPLHLASWDGSVDIVTLLLEKGAAIDSATSDGWTSLHVASGKGYVDIVTLLLEKGAGIDSATPDGMTPLHLASENGYVDIVTLLLEKGAGIDSATPDGRTSLHLASWHGSVDVATLLLERGADIASVDKDGFTSLHFAVLGNSIEAVTLLLDKGAVLNSVANGGVVPLHLASLNDSPDVVNLLLDKEADIDSVEFYMGTPLRIASVSGHLDVVNLRLERGAAIESGNFDDRRLLRYIPPHDQLEVITNFLRSTKFKIDIRVERGCAPLFYVIARGPSRAVQLLLPRLPANAKDRYSAMPLPAAMRKGHEEAIDKLTTLAGRQSNLDGLGRDLIWWVIGTGRGRVLDMVRQEYTQKFGTRITQGSNDKPWSFVDLDQSQSCDVCTLPIPTDTPYRRCEDCNNFNICSQCVGVKVECLDTAHEWSSREPDGFDNDVKGQKDG